MKIVGTNTTRLGLYKPGGAPELVNRTTNLNDNYDRIDYAAGCIHVADGATPADNQLFDGAIVRETSSGKIWVARTNGLGGYTKKWVNYPWLAEASGSFSTNSGGTPVEAVLSTWTGGLNSSGSDIVSGRFVVPVSGVYSCVFTVNFDPRSTATPRGAAIKRNNQLTPTAWDAPSQTLQQSIGDINFDDRIQTSALHSCSAGHTLVGQTYQFSGTSLHMDFYLRVALIHTFG